MTLNHIPLDHPKVQRVKELIPEKYWQYTWIAGSAASRYPLALEKGGDVDVWTGCNMPWREYDEIYNIFYDAGYVRPLSQNQEDEEYDLGYDRLFDAEGIQIMGTTQSISSVVSTFDISCHAAAVCLDPTQGQHTHKLYDPMFVRLLSWRDAKRSITRGCKFAYRYGDLTFFNDPQSIKCAQKAFAPEGWRVSEGL